MNNADPWREMLEATGKVADFDERQAKIDRISRDPRPEYAPPVQKPYKMTEPHFIMCVDEENANLSMPEAGDMYGSPHKLGGILLSDRFDVPLGWAKTPPKGTSIDALKDTYPEIFAILEEKKVTNF